MSQKQLAEAAGIAPQSISNWKGAQCDPNLRHLRGLAAALGIPIAALVEDRAETTTHEASLQLLAKLAALQLRPTVLKLGDSAPSLLDLLNEAERLAGGDSQV